MKILLNERKMSFGGTEREQGGNCFSMAGVDIQQNKAQIKISW